MTSSGDFTPEQIAADRQINGKATKGPWRSFKPKGKSSRGVGPTEDAIVARVLPGFHDGIHHAIPNAEFIANARTRFPLALEEIERLQAENVAMSEALAKAGHADDCTHNWTDGDMCDCHLKHLPDAVARGKKLLELERRDTPASILRHSGFRSFACKCGGFPEQDSKFCGECGSRLEWV